MSKRMHLSTSIIPEKERLDFWRETVCKVYLELRTERLTSGAFFGEMTYSEHMGLQVSQVHTAAQRYVRGATEVARGSPDDRYFVCIQLSGTCRVDQGGAVFVANPGDIEVLDGTQRGELIYESAYRRIIIAIPGQVLRPRLLPPLRNGSFLIQGTSGIGSLASDYLCKFAQGQLPPDDEANAPQTVVELLALAGNARFKKAPADAPSVHEARRQQIKTHVELNLSDSSLNAKRVAKDFRISLRYLYSVFSGGDQTFRQWITSRRLERCRADLANPAMSDEKILNIATNWGFADHTHFTRKFKEAYGMTPSEWREEALRKIKYDQ
ncbi:MAG TPA: helix-turn-helix domain-containing protein [Myxococcaceae bacterium]|nr:helix-turn-helix domain-containing protein [Myxococcaceae bacterium]